MNATAKTWTDKEDSCRFSSSQRTMNLKRLRRIRDFKKMEMDWLFPDRQPIYVVDRAPLSALRIPIRSAIGSCT